MRSKYLFLALTASALALAAVPASAGVAVTTTRVTVNSAGETGSARPGDSSNLPISISATGRFVAFSSAPPNLVADDGNYWDDVFVRDRVRGETTRVSTSSAGAVPNGDSAFPSISANGRFVAFASLASNLVPGDRTHRFDVFVRDLKRGTTTRVSVNSAGEEANDGSIWLPAISDNGRVVAFFSRSTNLVPNDHNGIADFFVRDLERGKTTRVSVSSTGEEQTSAPAQKSWGSSLRSPTTGASSPSSPRPRTWSEGTTTAPMTSSSATESLARRPGSASAPPARRRMGRIGNAGSVRARVALDETARADGVRRLGSWPRGGVRARQGGRQEGCLGGGVVTGVWLHGRVLVCGLSSADSGVGRFGGSPARVGPCPARGSLMEGGGGACAPAGGAVGQPPAGGPWSPFRLVPSGVDQGARGAPSRRVRCSAPRQRDRRCSGR